MLMSEYSELTLTSSDGRTVVIGFQPTASVYGYAAGYAEINGEKHRISFVGPVPAERPKPFYWYKHLWDAGASHFIRVDDVGDIGLSEVEAGRYEAALKDAQADAKRLEEERDAAHARDIRATKDVRRVLRESPYYDDRHALEYAYSTDPDSRYREGVWLHLPGVGGQAVHACCPSLAAVQRRSEIVGSYLGHTNTLFAVSDADWDLLIAESAAMVEQDARRKSEREEERSRENARLRAVTVPPDAIRAYSRYQGDPERAWENEDERAWSLICEYGAAIEAQTPEGRRLAVRRMVKAAGAQNPVED